MTAGGEIVDRFDSILADSTPTRCRFGSPWLTTRPPQLITAKASGRRRGATHDFEVTNYPLFEGMGVGRCISSSTFTVGGYDWNVRFYPDGDDEDSAAAGKASAFL